MSQKSLRWRRALSPRKSSLQEEWVLRGLTLHQLKDIITDIYAAKSKADARFTSSPFVSMQSMPSPYIFCVAVIQGACMYMLRY